MKKRVVCMSLILLMIAGSFTCHAENVNGCETKGVETSYDETKWMTEEGYDYPVDAEDEKWEEFCSHDEMVAACNMPKGDLQKVSTEELVNLILDYPLLGDLMLYDDVLTGFEIMSKESNILKEILSRKDGAEELLNAYCTLEISKESALPDDVLEYECTNEDYIRELVKDDEYSAMIEEDYNNVIQDVLLETALAQDEIIDELSEKEISILNEEVADKVECKLDSELYSAYTFTFYEVADEEGTIEQFEDIEIVSDDSASTTVKGNDTYAYVRTPRGSKVEVVKRTFNAAETKAAYNYTVNRYPKAIICADATTNYNCHSYAWYNQATTNKYWMNNPGKYMTDGSYKKVGAKPTATNQKVCYIQYQFDNPYIHSGIVKKISGNIITIHSKWGAGPLVRHPVGYSPYGGTPTYYKR